MKLAILSRVGFHWIKDLILQLFCANSNCYPFFICTTCMQQNKFFSEHYHLFESGKHFFFTTDIIFMISSIKKVANWKCINVSTNKIKSHANLWIRLRVKCDKK